MIIQTQSPLKKLALGSTAIVALTFTSVASAQNYGVYNGPVQAPVYQAQPIQTGYYQPQMRPVQYHPATYHAQRFAPVQRPHQPVYTSHMPGHYQSAPRQRYGQAPMPVQQQRLIPPYAQMPVVQQMRPAVVMQQPVRPVWQQIRNVPQNAPRVVNLPGHRPVVQNRVVTPVPAFIPPVQPHMVHPAAPVSPQQVLRGPQSIVLPQLAVPHPVPEVRLTPPKPPKYNDTHIESDLPDNLAGDQLRPSHSATGFKISVDGHTVAGHGFDYESHQEHSDIVLRDADVQVKFDGFDVTPRLNVGLLHNDVSIYRGQDTEFHVYSNYWNFIDHGEVRLYLPGQPSDSEPLAILPVEDGVARFMPGADLPETLSYQLRVYDSFGRFDETRPKTIYVTDKDFDDHLTQHSPAATLNIYGEDHTLRRNIPVKGANVTVSGEGVPLGYVPSVFFGPVPVDPQGRFATQQILPFGDRRINVSILNEFGHGVNVARDIHIKTHDFFYVGLGDLTLGQRQAIGPVNLQAADDEDWDDVVFNGRGAFYLKGKVRGDTLITAALDTGEERIKDLFNNLDEKDPRQLLRRLHADQYYPVYGDHSTLTEDAPTQGKFYIRVEKDDNHIMWGNFVTDIQATEFTKHERGLYGGIVDLNSEGTTSFGERRSELTAYAADPGTVPETEVFRGTGGSVYFLQNQDLSIGSERVQIEIVDKVTDIVKERRTLRPYEDYDVDYIQGRIVLKEALQSTAGDGQIVRDGPLSGDKVYLVVRYEHTPGLNEVSGYTVGGRATQWLGDIVRVGASGKKDTTGIADREVYGGDVLIRGGSNTFLKGEYAESRGPGFTQTESTDGGFIFDEFTNTGASNMIAKAYRLEGQTDLQDLGLKYEKINGRLRGLAELTDDGFNGTGRQGRGDIERYHASAELNIGDRIGLNASYDDLDSGIRGTRRAAYVDGRYKVNDTISVGAGIRRDEQNNADLLAQIPSSPNPLIQGQRTDASVQVNVEPIEDVKLHAFGQMTIDRDGTRQRNDRYGIGAEAQITSRVKVSGEVSDGDGGLGASGRIGLKKDDNSEIYLGYALDPDHPEQRFNRGGSDLTSHGVLTAGGRAQLNDSLSIYGEERLGWGDEARSFTHAYGVNYKPDEHWSLTASVENGQIEDEISGNFDRTAFSVTAAHATDKLRVSSNVEGRFEEGVFGGQERDRTTWLMRNTLAYDAYEDIQLLGRLNFALSESDQAAFQDAEYVEGVAGLAYRPVDHDWLNALFKYTYYEDFAPARQTSNLGRRELPRQKSQIISADTIVDVTEKLSVGAKYGYRMGEVELGRGTNDFVSSDAHLGILRADYHVIKNWDIMAEGRMMRSDLADETQFGALGGVYRHVGDNLKVGVGYSFSKFSDDLTNFDNDQQGFFLNVVGKI